MQAKVSSIKFQGWKLWGWPIDHEILENYFPWKFAHICHSVTLMEDLSNCSNWMGLNYPIVKRVIHRIYHLIYIYILFRKLEEEEVEMVKLHMYHFITCMLQEKSVAMQLASWWEYESLLHKFSLMYIYISTSNKVILSRSGV